MRETGTIPRSDEQRGEKGGMSTPTIFEACRPRGDVLSGAVADADFAADLASVVAGPQDSAYGNPAKFFADTYPTRGLQNLLANVCRRLSGAGGEVAAIFRLDTAYGGGKTHGLIALTHAARGFEGVSNISEFVDEQLVPSGPVRIAAFDGENADPANGRRMGDDVLAYTPWGEIAHALAGKEGYERVRKSDETGMAPGSETIRELFGGEPTLILLDELSVYLRKLRRVEDSWTQLTAFLTSLFKAVEGAPQAALVYTLAIGKDGIASDAYSQENDFIARQMSEAESVSARKATLLNPTEEDETVLVLKRRLFEHIDERKASTVIDAYRDRWAAHRESLSGEASRPETVESFRASYPLHPEMLETLMGKTATGGNCRHEGLHAHPAPHLPPHPGAPTRVLQGGDDLDADRGSRGVRRIHLDDGRRRRDLRGGGGLHRDDVQPSIGEGTIFGRVCDDDLPEATCEQLRGASFHTREAPLRHRGRI